MVRALSIVVLAGACGRPADRGSTTTATNAATPAVDAATVDAVVDDCTLDRAAIASQLRHGDAGIKTLVSPTFTESDRHLTEAVSLADGTQITFRIGGCAHYAWTLTFEIPSTAVGADAEQRLDVTDRLLRLAPMRDRLALDMADLIRARPRTTPRPSSGPWPIPCGDATCSVAATPSSATLRLDVSYDFPL